MQYVGTLFSTVTEFYKELNPATLSGAIDVIVVKQPDGTWACSPFHVRFGKLQLLRPHEKVVEVRVNDTLLEFRMKLGEAGEAFFVFESENPVPSEFATSPLLLAEGSDTEDVDFFALNGGEVAENPETLSEADVISSLLAPEGGLQELEARRKSLHVGKHVSKDEIVSNLVLKEGEQLILDKKGYNVNSAKRSVLGQHHNLSDTNVGEYANPSPTSLREVKSDAEGGAFSSDEEQDGNSEGNERHFSDSEFDYKKNGKSSNTEARQTNGYRKWTSWFSRSSTSLALSSDDESGETQDAANGKELRGRKYRVEKADSISETLVEEGDNNVYSVPKKRGNYAKTLRLTSEQLKAINLSPGANDVTFSVGKASCAARIFLWNHDDLVVISDIDGTITKSDALGHLFNMVGKDWTHPGVAKLYSDISRNGYRMLYLTSRAIGQVGKLPMLLTLGRYHARVSEENRPEPESAS